MNPRPKAPEVRVFASHLDKRAETTKQYDKEDPTCVHSWARKDMEYLGPGFEKVLDEDGKVVEFRGDILVKKNRKEDEAERRTLEEVSISTVKANWLSPLNEAPELKGVDRSLRHVATPRTPPKEDVSNPELTGG